MKSSKIRKQFLEELKKIPNISIAAQKVGISRNTPYEWKKKNVKFAQQMDDALTQGDLSLNDLAESKMLTKVNEGHWAATKYLLSRRHPKYMSVERKAALEPKKGSRSWDELNFEEKKRKWKMYEDSFKIRLGAGEKIRSRMSDRLREIHSEEELGFKLRDPDPSMPNE